MFLNLRITFTKYIYSCQVLLKISDFDVQMKISNSRNSNATFSCTALHVNNEYWRHKM